MAFQYIQYGKQYSITNLNFFFILKLFNFHFQNV